MRREAQAPFCIGTVGVKEVSQCEVKESPQHTADLQSLLNSIIPLIFISP